MPTWDSAVQVVKQVSDWEMNIPTNAQTWRFPIVYGEDDHDTLPHLAVISPFHLKIRAAQVKVLGKASNIGMDKYYLLCLTGQSC